MSPVDAWRAQCAPQILLAIDALRTIAATADSRLVESIKWNAPSFSLDGKDRITLGVERKGGVRVVLHRGAAKHDDDFSFEDPDGLARWLSPDRGMLHFDDVEAVERDEGRLLDLFRRWLKAAA